MSGGMANIMVVVDVIILLQIMAVLIYLRNVLNVFVLHTA